jgi:hypothetical protein
MSRSSVVLDIVTEDPLPYQAGFVAAKAFLIYATRFRSYFPSVKLIAPG